MSGFGPVKTAATDDFFRAFKADAKVDASDYAVVGFGDSEKMADGSLKLVLDGISRTRSTLARTFIVEGLSLPAAGDYAVVVDFYNKPRCVTRTTEVAIEVLLATADARAFEDSGRFTRENWLRTYREKFTREAAAKGFQFNNDMEIVWEEFAVVWPRLFADDWKGPRLQ